MAKPQASHDERQRAKYVARARSVAMSVAKHLHVPEHLMFSRDRTNRVARARMIAFYISHEGLGISLTLIGEAFGRDHSTVLHGVREVEQQITENRAPSWMTAAIDSILKVMRPAEAPDASEHVVSAYFALNAKQKRNVLARIAVAEAAE